MYFFCHLIVYCSFHYAEGLDHKMQSQKWNFIIKHSIYSAMIVIFMPCIRKQLSLIAKQFDSQNSKDAGCLVKGLLVRSTSTGLSVAAELRWWKRFSVCWEDVLSLENTVLHVLQYVKMHLRENHILEKLRGLKFILIQKHEILSHTCSLTTSCLWGPRLTLDLCAVQGTLCPTFL